MRAVIASIGLWAALPIWAAALQTKTNAASTAVAGGVAHPPVLLTPHYTPGDTLRYQVALRSRTKSLVGGAVENPEGATELGIAVGLTLRLEALVPVPIAKVPAKPPGKEAERAPLRLRATYEHVAAELLGDSYDPAAVKLLVPYKNLEGRSFEFQLGPHGEVEYMKGLEELGQDARTMEAARSWFEQLGAGLGAPVTGVAPGQTWEQKRAVPGAPLEGTELQSKSTYLRDEPCDVEKPEGEQCAVVLMQFAMGQKPGGKNATPEEFRKRGLRTSGEWTSHGESLVYVSLVTGRTVSVTQSSDEWMDLNIRHENGGTPFRYAVRAQNETHLLLLSDQPAQ